jgi:hypothetical protein
VVAQKRSENPDLPLYIDIHKRKSWTIEGFNGLFAGVNTLGDVENVNMDIKCFLKVFAPGVKSWTLVNGMYTVEIEEDDDGIVIDEDEEEEPRDNEQEVEEEPRDNEDWDDGEAPPAPNDEEEEEVDHECSQDFRKF